MTLWSRCSIWSHPPCGLIYLWGNKGLKQVISSQNTNNVFAEKTNCTNTFLDVSSQHGTFGSARNSCLTRGCQISWLERGCSISHAPFMAEMTMMRAHTLGDLKLRGWYFSQNHIAGGLNPPIGYFKKKYSEHLVRDLLARMFPIWTNARVVSPKGANGARWCVPADTVTKDEHTNPIKTMKLSIRQLSTVSRANLSYDEFWDDGNKETK